MTYLLANLLLSTYHRPLSSWSPLYAPNSLLSGLSWSLGVLLASMPLVWLSVLLYARVRWMEDPGNGVDNLAGLTQVLVVVFGEKHGFTSVALAGGTNVAPCLTFLLAWSFKAEGVLLALVDVRITSDVRAVLRARCPPARLPGPVWAWVQVQGVEARAAESSGVSGSGEIGGTRSTKRGQRVWV
ncbi:hypothetical protein B0H14DRAFT_2838907 [Mycena olivaceomarginata]|nr:hypothetical protein B0H14DRAFT_2838907 [Mycena olivaceomarginata]